MPPRFWSASMSLLHFTRVSIYNEWAQLTWRPRYELSSARPQESGAVTHLTSGRSPPGSYCRQRPQLFVLQSIAPRKECNCGLHRRSLARHTPVVSPGDIRFVSCFAAMTRVMQNKSPLGSTKICLLGSTTAKNQSTGKHRGLVINNSIP